MSEVTVTQEDRDAVFAWQNASSHAPNKLAEAFARNRTTAIAALEAENAELRAEVDRLRRAVAGAYFEGFSDGPGDDDDAIGCWQQSAARATLERNDHEQ